MESASKLLDLLGDSAEVGIKMRDYHARAACLGGKMSSHAMSVFRKSPFCFKAHKQSDKQEPTAAMILGSMFHKVVLEFDDFNNDFMTDLNAPVNPTTGKSYGRTSQKFIDWKSQIESTGKEVVTAEEFDTAVKMAQSIWSRPDLMTHIHGGMAELTVSTEVLGVECQIRPDYLKLSRNAFGDEILVAADLKKTRGLEFFCYDASSHHKFEYQYQLAFYRLVLSKVTGFPFERIYQPLIACEEGPYYQCGEFYFDERRDLTPATNEIKASLVSYRNALEKDNWPTGYEQPTLIR